jgi:hypothetical protein
MNRATRRQQQSKTARAASMLSSPVIPTQYREVELQERLCLLAFERGLAGPEHWNSLAECRNVLLYGAGHRLEECRKNKTDGSAYQEVIDLCNEVKLSMQGISHREQTTGRFGMDADQRRALTALVNTSADFWPMQPHWLFYACVTASRKQTTEILQAKHASKQS